MNEDAKQEPQSMVERAKAPGVVRLVWIVLLTTGIVLVGVGLAADLRLLAWAGIGLALAAVAVLLGVKNVRVSLGFISFEVPLVDVTPPLGAEPVSVENLYDESVTVLVNRSSRQVFIEAPKLVQEAASAADFHDLDPRKLGSLVAESLKPTRQPVAPPPWIRRPGETVPVSGIYDVVDDRGRFLDYQEAVAKGATFPSLADDATVGYVIRKVALHMHPPEVHPPGDVVPYSGIYDVVGAQGDYQNHQIVCSEGGFFPPSPNPFGFGYVLHERAASKVG